MNDKQRQASIILERHRRNVNEYRNLCYELEYLRYKASGAGAIRYDKERVQTSPEDMLLECMAEITEKDAARKKALEVVIKEADKICETISRIKSKQSRKMLYTLYVDCVYDLEALSVKTGISYDTLYKSKLRALERFTEAYTTTIYSGK